MGARKLHVVHLLIRRKAEGAVQFVVYPHQKWKGDDGKPYFSMPMKKTVGGEPAPFEQGTSLEVFVDRIMREDLGVADDHYAIEQEIEPAQVSMFSPTHNVDTDYTIYPVDIWVDPGCCEELMGRLDAQWLRAEEGRDNPAISPTARAVFDLVLRREARLSEAYTSKPEDEQKAEAPRRLLTDVPAQPSMDALAKKWFSRNKSGVRVLEKGDLDRVLDAGNRAFNLRVADPYLRYQMQGVGFTWSFFTYKDRQDTHVHGAPVVEIYGVLEGRLEIWWKPYYDRGTSAWQHRILCPGDWAEVDSLQCHIVNWLTEGKSVVFKAGPGPLAEVGKLGVKGKTPCDGCPCMKPEPVRDLEAKLEV